MCVCVSVFGYMLFQINRSIIIILFKADSSQSPTDLNTVTSAWFMLAGCQAKAIMCNNSKIKR